MNFYFGFVLTGKKKYIYTFEKYNNIGILCFNKKNQNRKNSSRRLICYEDNMLRIPCSRTDLFIIVNMGLLYRDVECPTMFITANQCCNIFVSGNVKK